MAKKIDMTRGGIVTEIPKTCPKCDSKRVVDARMRSWHLPAVKCQICGWFAEIAIAPVMPNPDFKSYDERLADLNTKLMPKDEKAEAKKQILQEQLASARRKLARLGVIV